VEACVQAHDLDETIAESDRYSTKDGLSASRWVSVQNVGDGRFARKACMHCLDPSCVSACLVGGITKSPQGPVIYDPDKCIGCRYCMLACPFHIPRYEWSRTVPFMRKCDMCYERLQQGGQPACVEACPNGALTFGKRKDLLEKAHSIIRNGPGKYHPRIWGESEFGGTSVLYISDVSLETLGWPPPDTVPIPSLTEPLISKTPFIGLSVAFGLVGLNWIVKRRMQLAEQNSGNEVSSDE
jgi:formate dehydrogenase iron-sulfur subunit